MEIQEIKQKLPIQKVLQYYNLSPDKNNMLNCPFHKDKTPSMKIYHETNTWTCFSSNCTAGTGDTIEFIQRKEKLILSNFIPLSSAELTIPSHLIALYLTV